MNRIVRNSVLPITSDGRLRARLCRCGLMLVFAFCFVISPISAKAACGRIGVPGLKTAIKLPVIEPADIRSSLASDRPTIVGLWHVVYTNSVDQSIFNDTFDTWHSDGTEFESSFLAPAGGDVCVGVWRQTDAGTVKLHHVGWLFAGAPTATATNIFTLDEEIRVADDNNSYSGTFKFKVWNLDGTATPVEVTGTIAATRITVH